MKLLSETKAVEKLAAIRSELQAQVSAKYEHEARSCSKCHTPGACCLDEHFVNVRISRLEARTITNAVDALPNELKQRVAVRTQAAIERYDLQNPDNDKFACPLYESAIGCLVHKEAKPLPCIVHACYDRAEDLPPDQLLEAAEQAVAYLNQRTYGNSPRMPIPVAVQKVLLRSTQTSADNRHRI